MLKSIHLMLVYTIKNNPDRRNNVWTSPYGALWNAANLFLIFSLFKNKMITYTTIQKFGVVKIL